MAYMIEFEMDDLEKTLLDNTTKNYVTFEVLYKWEKTYLRILKESDDVLNFTKRYQSSSSGDFGFYTDSRKVRNKITNIKDLIEARKDDILLFNAIDRYIKSNGYYR